MLPGAIAGFGQGINNSSEVGGWSWTASGLEQAFVWTPSRGIQDR
jgi:probable HAF family extracellular repeat protein